MATTDRSGRTQCQTEKTGIVDQITRWQDSKAEQRGYHPPLEENHSWYLNNIKASAAIAWQISPLCQHLMWRSLVQNGTDNMQVHQRGEKAKVVPVSLENLVAMVPHKHLITRVGVHQRQPIRGPRFTTMSCENETPAEKINLTQRQHRGDSQTQSFRVKGRPEVMPWPKERKRRPCDRWEGHGSTRDCMQAENLQGVAGFVIAFFFSFFF